jgi:hypothetical protein
LPKKLYSIGELNGITHMAVWVRETKVAVRAGGICNSSAREPVHLGREGTATWSRKKKNHTGQGIIFDSWAPPPREGGVGSVGGRMARGLFCGNWNLQEIRYAECET